MPPGKINKEHAEIGKRLRENRLTIFERISILYIKIEMRRK